MTEANFDVHVCLCCGQWRDEAATKPITPERAARAWRILSAQGFTRAELLGERRAQMEFHAPGFTEWLERERPQ